MADSARGAAWKDVPVFGEPVPGYDYRPRPGAYAAIFDGQGRVAVVRTRKGHFLPGGGTEPGETPEETLRREVAEEIGHGVTDLERLGEAAEWVLSTIEDEPVRKQGVYFTASLGPLLPVETESDHTLFWLTPEEAIARLSHRSQAWVIDRLERRRAARPAPGEADLARLLFGMEPALDKREFAFCSLAPEAAEPLLPRAWATAREAEGVTLILEAAEARSLGLSFDATWALITLSVHSSLSAVGFLAAMAAALAREGLSVNAVSAYYHDHLFVPWAERQRAVAVLEALSKEKR